MGWKKLSSKLVFENDWMALREDDVVNPGGGKNAYAYVHFKNVAVAIIAIDEELNTWLVGQERYTFDKYSWELPMGGAPADEEPLDAAKRELKEETGLSANSWEEILRLDVSNSITDEVGVVFVAKDLTMGETAFEETEDLAIRKLPLSKAIEMAVRGEIRDAISVAALLRMHHGPVTEP